MQNFEITTCGGEAVTQTSILTLLLNNNSVIIN